MGELLEWSSRQLSITRVYHPLLWKKSFLAQGVNSMTLWGGALFLTYRLWFSGVSWRWSDSLLLSLMCCVYLLGCLKGYLRLRSVSQLFQDRARALWVHWPALVCAGPLASLISLKGFVHSLFSRRIRWRGIVYLMVSPEQTRVAGDN